MMKATEDGAPTTLMLAIESLDNACHALDAAVLALPNVRGDDVMATPGLVALLLRVVTARRQVVRLELDLKAGIRSHLLATTVS